MLSMTYADLNHVDDNISVQELPHVQHDIRSTCRKDIAARIDNPDETYLLARDDVQGDINFAYLRGIANTSKSVELCALAIGKPSLGYGRQFLPTMLSHTFNELSKHRDRLDAFQENAAARHLYEKQGFVRERTLRDAYFWKGEFRSAELMSRLASEFPRLDRCNAVRVFGSQPKMSIWEQ